jgi:putative ABC transport system permease protein
VEADQALEREKETRKQLKERRLAFAAVFVPLVVVVSVVWLAFLIWSNVRQRKTEIGILSAMGLPARSILFLFIGKAVIVGLAGSLVGFGAGVALVAVQGGAVATVVRSSDIPLAAGYLLVAVLMSMVASWVPALMAARMDPAVSLREGD